MAATEEVAAFLRSRGVSAAAYSGRTDDAERRQAEDDLLGNRIKALVATSALGMGFDKPDLGFVVHLGAPASPIAYYQQVGRAGRGVDRAQVVLLPGAEDEAIWRYFASLGFPSEEQVRTTLAALGSTPLSTAALEARVDLRRTRLETMLKVLDVDGAVRRVQGGWTSTGRPWAYDADRYARVAADRAAEQQAMRDYAATEGCRMEFLRRQLDDPDVTGPGSAPCGRCDRCTGVPLDESVTRRLARGRAGRARPPGRRGRAAQAVADGDGRRGRRPQRAHPRPTGRPTAGGPSGGCPTSAGAPACAPCSRARTGRCPTTCSAPW